MEDKGKGEGGGRRGREMEDKGKGEEGEGEGGEGEGGGWKTRGKEREGGEEGGRGNGSEGEVEEMARRRGRVRAKRHTMKGKKEVRWKEKENGTEGYEEICEKRGSLKGREGTKEETEDNVL